MAGEMNAMIIRRDKGLTFDDVLLVPKRSPFATRGDVHTASRLAADITLEIPIISANMDTVTEAAMAIAMARAGGIGVIHRFMPPAAQVDHVARVKRAEGYVVSEPYAIGRDATVGEVRALMERLDVGGLVVLDESGKLAGLITRRDVLLAPDDDAPLADALTPAEQVISTTPETSLSEAQAILYRHRLEKLPVLDANGQLVGLITAQDVIKERRHPHATKDERGRLRVGAAIGVKAGDLARAEALHAAGADLLVLDIAHGHADHCLAMLARLRRELPEARLVAGNVATREGARDLAEAGADAIKVGIGPGSICTTRVVTGFGVPQITAIIDSAAGIRDAGRDIPLIADGGIRDAGDIVKALAAGADAVMIGSMFAGCEEAPGAAVIRGGQKFKVVRGMASLGAAMGRYAAEAGNDESAESQADWEKVVPEGVEAVVPYRGYVHEMLYQLVGGLRSGLSYGGARNIAELQEKAEFIEITAAGALESRSHDVHAL
jgi:IMP dehydrogenase